MVPPWSGDAPNHGFQLTLDGRVVGAHLAFYSRRRIGAAERRFCNLAAWCVLDDYHAEGLRLLRALLAQRDYEFADLSPSGNVIALNERLRFRHLDTSTALVPAVPWFAPGVRVSSDPDELARALEGPDAELYRDHVGAAAAIHLLVTHRGRSTYVVVRRERRKGVAGFGSFLYVGDRDVLRAAFRPLAWHLLVHHRIGVLLAETRLTGPTPRGSATLRHARPKMLRSEHADAPIDYLYSELACVAW